MGGREVGRWGPCWSVLTVANKQMRKQNNFYSSPADGSSAARVWLPCSPYQGQLAWSVCCPDWPVAPQWAVWAARPFSRCVCGWARAANLTKVGAKWKITFKNAITITNKDTKSKWQMGQSASPPVCWPCLAWPVRSAAAAREPEAERTWKGGGGNGRQKLNGARKLHGQCGVWRRSEAGLYNCPAERHRRE